MEVIAVVGMSGSGKTTTIEYLTSRLTQEGYKVGTIKHIHHTNFSIDTKGTDTWRHAHAGAMVTIAIAPKEMVIIKKTDDDTHNLDRIIKFLGEEELDFVFIEGLHSLIAKKKGVFKIIVAKDAKELMMTLNGTAEPILAITGVITKRKLETTNINVPIIDIDGEGDLLLKLVKDICLKRRK
ncbi:MAG: molybdopterin-guanine dinucleotide biosynthesis protein B [Candidatus Bathyarchaeia archaeon]